MPPISNKIHDIFLHYQKKMPSFYSEKESQSILYLLFEHLFGLSRLDIFVDADRRLSESEIILVYDAVNQLNKNVPIQYIIGKTEFCGLTFEVNSSTLIPRPETEELVMLVLKASQNQSIRILDIGTGSGAIAISIKKQNPNAHVFACDISQEALKTAQKNATINKTKISFFECDILSKNAENQLEMFDIIVSNPPYIPQSEMKIIRPNVVEYEPHSALFVPDENPLVFYEAIMTIAQKKLSKNGKLFFEIHENQGDKLKLILFNIGFKDAKIEKDLFGKNRFICA